MDKRTKALIKQAKSTGTPIIEGEQVIFIWEGEDAPFLLGDFNQWGTKPNASTEMAKVTKNVWMYEVKIPVNAYIEYTYLIDLTNHDTRIADPLNPQLVDNGMEDLNNYFYMPEAIQTPLLSEGRDLPQGMISRHVIQNDLFLSGGKRDVWLYKPINTTHPTPLLVVYDGFDYLKRGEITYVVDKLIAQKHIPPIAIALVDNGRKSRIVEYTLGDAMLISILEDVLPLAHEHLNLLDIDEHPGVYGVCGSSMGGLMALYTALRHPHIFGWAVCQSPSMQILKDDPRSPLKLLINQHKHDENPVRLWMDVGEFEINHDLILENAKILQDKGFNLTVETFMGGHNFTSWRSVLNTALTALIGTNR